MSGKTSTQAKARWNAENYKRYQVYLRYDEDKDLIAYVESKKETIGTTELFREALELHQKNGA